MSIKIYVKYVKNNRDFHTTKLNLPTGNLDYQTGQEIMKLICASRELYRQTIVMVTHDMDSANYADRIVYMEDGAVR